MNCLRFASFEVLRWEYIVGKMNIARVTHKFKGERFLTFS